MTDQESSSGGAWQYRFLRPGGVEIETREFNGDDAAETYARELSKARETPVIIQRFHGHVDWQYVTEVDARP
jgi:hypothetical protein